ncbi:hypothetical protein D3C76_1740610 [compost metagenome]
MLLLEAPLVGAVKRTEPSARVASTAGRRSSASAPVSSSATGSVLDLGTGVAMIRLLILTVIECSPEQANGIIANEARQNASRSSLKLASG